MAGFFKRMFSFGKKAEEKPDGLEPGSAAPSDDPHGHTTPAGTQPGAYQGGDGNERGVQKEVRDPQVAAVETDGYDAPSGAPRPTDNTEIEVTNARGPDAHAEAAGNVIADEEAGADLDKPDEGGITPLAEMQRHAKEGNAPGKAEADGDTSPPSAEDDTSARGRDAETDLARDEPQASQDEPQASQDAPPEDDMVVRAEARADDATPSEQPLDASHPDETASYRGPATEPPATDGPAPAYESNGPGDGLDPSTSPVEPSRIAGGTVTDHATEDSVRLEETGELPDHEHVEGAATPDAAPAARAVDRPKRFSSADLDQRARPHPEPTPEPEARRGFFARLTKGLGRSSRELTQNITAVFTKRKLDDDTLQDLEDVLIRADLGVETAMRVTERLADSRYGKEVGADEVRRIMADEVARVLDPVARPLELDLETTPHVILVVGVNGTGKTTTIGKLAAKLREGGLTVMLAAGDTFRAAAIEQLHIWGDRVGAEVVSTRLGADAAGLAYEAYEKAKASGVDVLLIDTAGRLQNKTELMDELAKVVRVLKKHDPEAPHTVLQTLDATTGQNALSQVEIFRERAGVGGLVMTKLDGTARGGILVAIAAKHKLPVWFVGVGESVEDLEPFRADEFAAAIAGTREAERALA